MGSDRHARRSGITLNPGTTSAAHLRDNLAAADLVLPEDAATELDALAA
jgi:aryl-alcohol dehydrogenase-like predicted oxidoreductase